MNDNPGLPPSQINVAKDEPLRPSIIEKMPPLVEGPDGLPIGFGNSSNKQTEPIKQEFKQPIPPRAKAPEFSTYFSQGELVEGHPTPPNGKLYDSLNNPIPVDFVKKAEEDPNWRAPANALYPMDLTEEMITSWKERFGNSNIYITTVLDKVYVFRAISRKEWVWIQQQGFDQQTFEDMITWTCLLFPKLTKETIAEWPAGIQNSVTEWVMIYSGFNSSAQPIRL